ncbi:hypothetical protein [Streptomyces sp. NPDC060194]|uniref:hypothetical protein n=1 Tax=Streptomyces sp. NPDC060194 TaxID=3347069 RepID=UPI00364DDAA0
MSTTAYYMLDVYRAAQHGDPAPPMPGRHDWQTLRALRDDRRFAAVVAGRPARGRLRAALAGALLAVRPERRRRVRLQQAGCHR